MKVPLLRKIVQVLMKVPPQKLEAWSDRLDLAGVQHTIKDLEAHFLVKRELEELVRGAEEFLQMKRAVTIQTLSSIDIGWGMRDFVAFVRRSENADKPIDQLAQEFVMSAEPAGLPP